LRTGEVVEAGESALCFDIARQCQLPNLIVEGYAGSLIIRSRRILVRANCSCDTEGSDHNRDDDPQSTESHPSPFRTLDGAVDLAAPGGCVTIGCNGDLDVKCC
jgi:hypothetical protein